jgi:hypothetical protein
VCRVIEGEGLLLCQRVLERRFEHGTDGSRVDGDCSGLGGRIWFLATLVSIEVLSRVWTLKVTQHAAAASRNAGHIRLGR